MRIIFHKDLPPEVSRNPEQNISEKNYSLDIVRANAAPTRGAYQKKKTIEGGNSSPMWWGKSLKVPFGPYKVSL